MDNYVMRLPVWCDISTKIIIGVTIALPACSFCITRHLEHVASSRYAISTNADKRRRSMIDICFTFGLPLLIMALHYVVQGHRFDLFEDIGCEPSTYIGIQAIFVLWVPPLVLSVGSLIYASIALRHFAIRRRDFEQHLKNSHSVLTTGRYLRLMALAVSEMLWGTALGSYVLYLNIQDNGLRPWISWENVHYHFSRVVVYPRILIPEWYWSRLIMTWWILPSTAFLFFVFFGFSDEAVEGYLSIFRWLRRNVLRQTLPVTTASSSGPYSVPPVRRRIANVVSIPTFPDGLSLDVVDVDTKQWDAELGSPPDDDESPCKAKMDDIESTFVYPGFKAAELDVPLVLQVPEIAITRPSLHPYAQSRDSVDSGRRLSAPATFSQISMNDQQPNHNNGIVVHMAVEKETV